MYHSPTQKFLAGLAVCHPIPEEEKVTSDEISDSITGPYLLEENCPFCIMNVECEPVHWGCDHWADREQDASRSVLALRRTWVWPSRIWDRTPRSYCPSSVSKVSNGAGAIPGQYGELRILRVITPCHNKITCLFFFLFFL